MQAKINSHHGIEPQAIVVQHRSSKRIRDLAIV